MNWDDIRIFLAVARRGSLTAAGNDLSMSASSVSRHIDELERRLGVVVFLRSQSGYALSDAGIEIFADAERAESSFFDIVRKASSSAEKLFGTVRVALPENFATYLVFPEVSQFIEAHPAITLEFVTNVSVTNLTRREADISLRLIRPETGNLVAKQIGKMATALYASSEYLAKHPFDPKAKGKGHLAICWDEMFSYLQASNWLQEQLPHAGIAVRTTSLQSQLAACANSVGLSVLPCFIADPVPNLVRIIPPEGVFSQNIWLTMHHDISKLARIRAVAQFLEDTLHLSSQHLLGITL